MNAKNIVGFMQEHGAAPSKQEGEIGDEDEPKKKKKLMPKLKPMPSLQRTQFRKIEPTTIKSGLD